MCVNLQQYPVVELDNGKRKVLFQFPFSYSYSRGVHLAVLENKDFVKPVYIDDMINRWNYAIENKSNPLYNDDKFKFAVLKYGIKKIIKYSTIPCGKCQECLKSKARGWAYRILKEAENYENNYFVTFTYDDEHLPTKDIFNFRTGEFYMKQSTLIKDEISKFNKSLKKKLHDLGLDSTFRFYMVGEYG